MSSSGVYDQEQWCGKIASFQDFLTGKLFAIW